MQYTYIGTMSANTPSLKLSILVPVYNTGNLLEPCLRSLETQDYDGIEFICIDDGSTDGSAAVLDAWAARDARFRVLHLPNGGYGKAMNRALAEARGEWVGIVEPDDTIEPTMYSHLMELAARTSALIVKGNYSIRRGETTCPAGKFSHLSPGTELPAETATDYILGPLAIWSAIYRRDWLQACGIHFSETPGAAFQDLGFAIRTWVAAAIPPPIDRNYSPAICVSPAAAYHYREDNPASSSRKLDEGAWNALHELELQADVFEKLPPDARTVRSLLVKRILHTLQADYRLRLSTRIPEYLAAYSALLNRHFPLHTLQASAFKKREWHDLQLIYNNPQQYPSRRRGNVSWLQRIYSCRREAGHRVLRLCGFTIHLSH